MKLHVHRYRTVADTGFSERQECRCGKRRILLHLLTEPTGADVQADEDWKRGRT